MRGALIFIGDELLSGEVSNLNAEVAIGELTGNGFEVGEVLAIPDQIEVIASHLRRIVEEYQFLICSGGLGPTDDDLTNQAVSKALGLPLEKNKEFSQAISSSPAFAKVQELAQKMALLPKGAVPLSKDLSCAGYYLLVSGKLLFFLPGVPHQFNQLLKEEVIPLSVILSVTPIVQASFTSSSLLQPVALSQIVTRAFVSAR
jgi:nicotinamide-nucleotide amidase